MAADLTTESALFKVMYDGVEVKRILYENRPLFAMLPKKENFQGASLPVPVIYNNSQNRSSNVTNAFSNNSTFGSATFSVTRKTIYGGGAVSTEALKASRSDAGAFVNVMTEAIDRAINQSGNAVASQLTRSGTGSVARLSATATVNSTSVYVQLLNPDDIVNLAVDMDIAASQNDGGTLRAYASSHAYIVSIDRDAGSFLCSATVGGSVTALSSLITSVAASDYIYQNSSDLTSVISGVQAWVVGTSVTATTFYGVDRTKDKTRLAGHTYDGSALGFMDAVYNACALLAREGGKPKHLFLNYKDYANFQSHLRGNQIFFQNVYEKSEDPRVMVSFAAIEIAAPTGPVRVFLDPYVPTGVGLLMQMDTWELASLGPIVDLFNEDGLDMIRDGSLDQLNFRITGYGNLICKAPGFNCVITLPSGS